jgi:hypothetical protein
LKELTIPSDMVDYRKWDQIVLSDDDDADCHPNIERLTWRRLKQQMREQRVAEDEERRKKDLEELESIKYSLSQMIPEKHESQIEDLKKRMTELLDRETRRKKREDSAIPKITESSLCHDSFKSKTIVNRENLFTSLEERSAQNQTNKGEFDEAISSEENQEKLERLVCDFVALDRYQDMGEFLFKHQELVSDKADTLLIMNAYALYKEHDSSGAYRYLRHSLIIRYILKLAEGKPSIFPGMRVFFGKILDEKDYKYRRGFELDLHGFFDQMTRLPSLPQDSG